MTIYSSCRLDLILLVKSKCQISSLWYSSLWYILLWAVRANVAWTNVDWKNVSWTNVPNSLNHLRFVKLGWLPNLGFLEYVEVRKKDVLRVGGGWVVLG